MDDPDTPNAYPLMMFRFPYPKVKAVELDRLVDVQQAAAKEFLHNLTLKRSELAALLKGKKDAPTSAAQVIEAAEKLFPMLMGLNQVLCHPATRLKKPLPFAWTSPVHVKERDLYIELSTFHFELIMMLNVLGAAHANRAAEHMAAVEPDDLDSFDEAAKQAAEELRIAAGVFDFIARVAVPKWKDVPPEAPYECNTTVAAAMRNLCLSAGQAIVVKKAKLHGTSQATVAKLCTGGFKKAEEAFKAVIGMRDTKCVSDNFKDFLFAHAVVHKSNALKSLGDAAYADEQYGLAIGYLKAANTCVNKIEKPAKDSPLAPYAADIANAQSIIHHKAALYVQENDNMYGKKEVDEKTVTVADDGTMLVKPTPFELPASSFRVI